MREKSCPSVRRVSTRSNVRRIARVSLLTLIVSLAATSAAPAEDNPEKKPSPETRGRVHAWKARDGLAYEYFIPKHYDPKVGANLTIVLHGSNLDRRWTFWNHPAGEFRRDDIVISPDGTSPNVQGGFNFLGESKGVSRLHSLISELKSLFTVRQTFLYGHSQGSFFAFYFAGEHPKEIDGICADASGCWAGTKLGKFGFTQAIGIMHGTDDPLVPYAQSRATFEAYRKAGYPVVHLRTLHGWGHPPDAGQASLVLAWCEGMTSSDSKRVWSCLETLTEATSSAPDYAALHQVASRVAGRSGPELKGAAPDEKAKSQSIVDAVEALAARHADAIRQASRKEKAGNLEMEGWLFHLARFLDGFDGVPAREALAKEWTDRIERQEKGARKPLQEFWQQREKAPAEAFEDALAAIREGFLHPEIPSVLASLDEMEKRARELKIPKAALAGYEKIVPEYTKAREAGWKAFADLNRKEGNVKW